MKKTPTSKSRKAGADEMLPEYQFDYSKAKPNRFANRAKENRLVVILDPDVAAVFTTPESVNKVLRALITALPVTAQRKGGRR
jgi:hypothetical protein